MTAIHNCNECVITKRNPVWSEVSKYIVVRVNNAGFASATIRKILCFNSSRFFHSHFLQAIVTCQTTDVTEHQKPYSFHARLKIPSILILTCPCMPRTLEGGGTISQLGNATAEKSCTVKGHSQFDECKTKRQSTLHLQYIL